MTETNRLTSTIPHRTFTPGAQGRGRRLGALLMAACSVVLVAAPESAPVAATVTITAATVQQNFLGMGFNELGQSVQPSSPLWESVIGKRMREITAGGHYRTKEFDVASYAPAEKTRTWTSAAMQLLVDQLTFLKDNGIRVLLCWQFNYNPAWLGGGGIMADDALIATYAAVVGEGMEYLVKTRGLTNIHSWELVNELSTNAGWASFYYQGSAYQTCHRKIITAVKAEFDRRGLAVVIRTPGVNNADAWQWGVNNHPESPLADMHWYFRNAAWSDVGGYQGQAYAWDDARQYGNHLDMYRARVAYARAKGKELAVGEYGPVVSGNSWEPTGEAYTQTLGGATGNGMHGLVIAEQAMAMLNAGISTIQKWTFTDLVYGAYNFYHGAMKGAAGNYETRADYYAYGLLCKYIRAGSAIHAAQSSDDLVRCAAARPTAAGAWSVAIVNRKPAAERLTVAFPVSAAPQKGLRRYLYDQQSWPQNAFGDLWDPDRKKVVAGGSFTDTVGPGCLALYTTEYDEIAPARVTGLSPSSAAGQVTLQWNASDDADLCYYRIYRGTSAGFMPSRSNQVASTIGTRFVHNPGQSGTFHYRVSAVDKYGNDSELGVPLASPPPTRVRVPEPAAAPAVSCHRLAVTVRGSRLAGAPRRSWDLSGRAVPAAGGAFITTAVR